MDLGQVEAFLALSEELHFGKAAQRLYVSQPMMSRRIAALERDIGGALFERTSRQVRLTPLGSQLRDQLQPAYAHMQAAIGSARGAARGVTGRLRVGFTATTPSEPLNRLLKAFERSYPDCLVTLCEHPMTGDDWDVWGPLRRAESDVLVYWLAVSDPVLTAGPALGYQDRLLLVARGHKLAGRKQVPADELADERVAQRPATFPPALMDAFVPPRTPSGQPIPRTEAVRSFHEMMSLVARGRMVHPTVTGVTLARRDDIVTVPLTGLPPIPFGLIWCTAQENARIRALAEVASRLQRQGHSPGGGGGRR